jgi:hypothetical protein
METQTPAILAALYGIMEDIGAIKKGKENKQQNYRFRGIDDALFNLKPLFLKHKVLCKIETISENYSEYQTKNGGSMFRVIVKNKFILISTEDGSREEYTITGEGSDSADKATPKAHSTAFKTWTWLAFCIPTEDAIDTEDTHHDEAVKRHPDKQPKKQLSNIDAAIKSVEDGKYDMKFFEDNYDLTTDQFIALQDAFKSRKQVAA